MVDRETALKLVKGRPWHHDFEIIPGVRTRGSYDPGPLWNELRLPADLTGVSLADVGASNGYFSFEARKRGARVTAFDFRHRDNSGFGLAQHINGMGDIEHHQVNVLDITEEAFGRFDVVLALGLFYHVSDPYLALANCGSISKRSLFVESYCIDTRIAANVKQEPVMRFISDPVRFPMYGHLNNDRSNFWGFTSTCLVRMLEDIGFAAKRMAVWGDRVMIEAERTVADKATRRNFAYGLIDRVPVGKDPDDPGAWTIF